MATASVTNIFANDTVMESAKVNENFQDLVDFLDAEVIHADGAVAFTGNVVGPFMPTTDDHLTKRAYVDANITNTGIAKATVDAAGDLLVASADNTPARLAKGADDTALTVVSGSVTWQAPTILPPNLAVTLGGELQVMRSNEWINASGNIWNGETPNAAANILDLIEWAGPFYVTSTISIDTLATTFAGIGTGVNIRMAVYKAHPTTFKPDTLVRETGSQAGAVGIGNTNVPLTSAVDLEPGNLYYLAYMVSASQGSMYRQWLNTGSGYSTHGAGFTIPNFTNIKKFTQAFTYGAFPATATPATVDSSTSPIGIPFLWFQPV